MKTATLRTTPCRKKVFIFYPRISQLYRSVQYVYQCKKTAPANNVMTAFNFKGRHEKLGQLAIAVHVLKNTFNFVISRCCFARDSKEMYL